MVNLTMARVSTELIMLLKEITNQMRANGKQPTKEKVCHELVQRVRYRSDILNQIKNDK